MGGSCSTSGTRARQATEPTAPRSTRSKRGLCGHQLTSSSSFAPPITPEQLYNQDKRKQYWDKQESKLDKEIERSRQWYGLRAERR
jgi:hypothetical protein